MEIFENKIKQNRWVKITSFEKIFQITHYKVSFFLISIPILDHLQNIVKTGSFFFFSLQARFDDRNDELVAIFGHLECFPTVADGAAYLNHRHAFMRDFLGDHFPQNDAIRVYIRCLGVLLGLEDFWGHPICCA